MPPSKSYTLSLHDALPILISSGLPPALNFASLLRWANLHIAPNIPELFGRRSEEHTSELQSRFDLVCRLLLEKKKNAKHHHPSHYYHRWRQQKPTYTV